MPKLRVTVKPGKSADQLAANPELKNAYLSKVLNQLSLMIPGYITQWIDQHHPFTSRTGTAAKSWNAAITAEGTIKISSLVAYSYWLNYGVHAHQMTYLLHTKAQQQLAFGKYMYWGRSPVPLPAKTGGGHIFRTVTWASIQAGHWRHPGRPATHFLEGALEALSTDLEQQYPQLSFKVTT
jgi:hypothetical protein